MIATLCSLVMIIAPTASFRLAEGANHNHYVTRAMANISYTKTGKIRKTTVCLIQKKKRHGGYRTPEWGAWRHIINRCTNPNVDRYPRYGGRGIKVCERWRMSFEAFLADVGPRPSSTHSIDRINNDGNYEPGNVRWATRMEQSMNRSVTVRVEWLGQTKTIKEWAACIGVPYKQLHKRIVTRKWPLERAMTLPMRGYT